MFVASDHWKTTYPGAAVGVLAMRGVANPMQHPKLTQRKRALEATLRARYAEHDRAALKDLPTLQAYAAYYKALKRPITSNCSSSRWSLRKSRFPAWRPWSRRCSWPNWTTYC